MADGIDQLQMMIKVMETIINPVNQSLAKYSEAAQLVVGLVNRLVEIYSQEPTRNTIIKELRSDIEKVRFEYRSCMENHDDSCKDRDRTLNDEAIRRMETILQKVSTVMNEYIADHEEKIISILNMNKKQNEELTQRVDRLTGKINWLYSIIFVSYTIAMGAYIYIQETVSKFDSIKMAIENLTHK